MKLIVDPSIHLSLKPLIAKEFTGFKCDIITLNKDGKNPNSEFNSAPLLELEDGQVLFSPNVISSYIFQKVNNYPESTECLNWLDWESSIFQPCAHGVSVNCYGSSKVDKKELDVFSKCMIKLNEKLSGNKFLLGDEVTVVDVAVWTDLFPVASNTKFSTEHIGTYANVLLWYNVLANENAFQKALDQLGYSGQYSEKLKKSLVTISIPSNTPTKVNTGITVQDKDLNTGMSQVNRLTSVTESEEEPHVALSEEEIAAAVQSFMHGRQTAPPPRDSTPPLLPQEGVKNILITSALPYVNNVPHLGNIIGCVLSADAFARYCRLRNYNTLYISGTDEYGTATETKALEENLTPREICDKYFKLHSEIYQWFQISFDHFGRTTTQQQTIIAQDIFWRLHKRGYMVEDSTNQQLCEKCDRFLADRFVEGTCPLCGYDDARGDQCDACGKLINAIELKSPRCKLCKTTPVVKMSKHLFLDLPKLQGQLEEWFEKSSCGGLWTNNATVITQSWLKEGLKPRCITRDLKWGTPVPLEGFTDKVFYVWFDAPIGYLSITANYTDEWERWWKNPSQVQLYQFMAKDNVPFHAVIFPSSQIGADDGYTIVNHLVATEYLNYEDGKFSKSRGVGVFGNQAQETGIPADIWRFYLLYTRPESQDSVFAWNDLMLKNNSELLNNFGNFINRGLAFLCNNFDGVVPEIKLNEDDKLFVAYIAHQLNKYLDLLEKVKIRDAIRQILNISRRGNQHIQSNKPWVLIKGTPDEKARAGSVIGLCTNVSCLLSVMIQPYMPTISKTIQEQINAPLECNVLMPQFVCYLPCGHKVGKPCPLFQKLEPKLIEELKKEYAGKCSRESTPETKNDILTKPQIDGLINMPAEELEIAITAQGDVVRQLKQAKAEKVKIQCEVQKLLELKAQLMIATGQVATNNTIQKSKKKKK